MTCSELADVAAELALGALTGRERALALAHLDTCEGCRESVLRLMTAAGELPGLLPASDPPQGFEAAVIARITRLLPRCGGNAVAGFTRRRRGRLSWWKRRGVAL
jgi:hypothetical protein